MIEFELLDRPVEVVRQNALERYTGLKSTQVDLLIALGLFNTFVMNPGGRSTVVAMSEVAALQRMMRELAQEGYKTVNAKEVQAMLRERAKAGHKFANTAELKAAIIETMDKHRKHTHRGKQQQKKGAR